MLSACENKDRAQYGMIEMEGRRVTGIVEWKYWKDFPLERQNRLRYCNAGVYAATKATLLSYMDQMEKRPHYVIKQHDGEWLTIKEYFLTDIAEMMSQDGLPVGITLASEEAGDWGGHPVVVGGSAKAIRAFQGPTPVPKNHRFY